MNGEYEYILERERAWRKHSSTLYYNGYLNDEPSSGVAGSDIIELYKQLGERLLAYERAGYVFPEAK